MKRLLVAALALCVPSFAQAQTSFAKQPDVKRALSSDDFVLLSQKIGIDNVTGKTTLGALWAGFPLTSGSIAAALGYVPASTGGGTFTGNINIPGGFAYQIGGTNVLTVSGLAANMIPATTVAAASYGSASNVATFTVGADGRLTLAGSAPIAISSAAVSGLAASATTDATNAANITSGTLPAGRLPAFTGDVTTSVGTSATTIASGAVTSGKLAAGVAVANIGYTPANKAGETFTGSVNTTGAFQISGTTALSVSGGHLLIGGITTPTTLNVPGTYATIAAALASIAQTRLYATVTIQVADGTTACPGEITHPDGALIQIIGNQATPANVIMSGSQANYGSCVLLKNDHALGFIDGFTLQATDGYTSPAVWTTGTNPFGVGLFAYHGGRIVSGYNIVITKWYYAERAELGGSIYNGNNGSTGPTATICGDVCFHAFNGGHIEARYAHASYAADINSGLGHGFLAEAGGTLVINSSFATYNAQAGIGALNGGSVWAQNTLSSNNGQFGYHAFVKGSIDASNTAGAYNGAPWTISTAYPTWAWVINGSKMYLQTAASCTSAGAGGPTGTGAAIADNTCVWRYYGAYSTGNGMLADRDGTIVAYQSAINHSGSDGLKTDGGTIDANDVNAQFNGGYGFNSTHLGKIYGTISGSSAGNTPSNTNADATSLVNF